MEALLKNVKKELTNIADKGISSSNLDATKKLVDIYVGLKEACCEEGGERDMYNTRGRGRDGRYRDSYDDWDYDDYGARGGRGGSRGGRGNYNGNYGHYPLDDRIERYFTRMREGMENYDEGRIRYRDGGSQERMVEGIEMTMAAIVTFVESLVDFAETSEEKEIVRKYANKIKKI